MYEKQRRVSLFTLRFLPDGLDNSLRHSRNPGPATELGKPGSSYSSQSTAWNRQTARLWLNIQGHPTTIFGKTSVRKTTWDLEFRNICCKISCFPASPRIFEHLKNGKIAHFQRIFTLKRSPRIFGSLFSGWNFRTGKFWSLKFSDH